MSRLVSVHTPRTEETLEKRQQAGLWPETQKKKLEPSHEILEKWSVTDRRTEGTAVFCRMTACSVDTTLDHVQDRIEFVAGGLGWTGVADQRQN